ncbi:hypothetical protein [Arcobacter sp.]|uniref:hypothetical protein n=1 Tax=Arcobacter sp. TaxID=1872629 RepID=UPI003D0A61A3
MENRSFLIGFFLICLGLTIFFLWEYYIPNINSAYKLLGIPVIFIGVKRIKKEMNP